MAVVITSSAHIRIVSGSGISINAPVVPLYTTDDIFNATNPAQTLTEELAAIIPPAGMKLLGTAQIDCLAAPTTETLIYTVPTGKSAVVAAIFVVANSLVNPGGGTAPKINIGHSGTFDEIVDGASGTFFATTVQGEVVPLGTGANPFPTISGDYSILTTGVLLKAYLATAATIYSAYTVTAYVFGFEF